MRDRSRSYATAAGEDTKPSDRDGAERGNQEFGAAHTLSTGLMQSSGTSSENKYTPSQGRRDSGYDRRGESCPCEIRGVLSPEREFRFRHLVYSFISTDMDLETILSTVSQLPSRSLPYEIYSSK